MAAGIPRGPDDKASLARIVDAARGLDEAENDYYESAADPLHVQNERARRRFRGSYFRRLRRLQNRGRDANAEEN